MPCSTAVRIATRKCTQELIHPNDHSVHGRTRQDRRPFGPLSSRVYTGIIAFVAALGGLLFGYDWVVIGGAKPFYEVYFNLPASPHADALIGWATSCALVGCLEVGSGDRAGELADRLSHCRPVLIASAILFAFRLIHSHRMDSSRHVPFCSSFWRDLQEGSAIGLASNVSPVYISEISPAHWRGRLVSLNQLALGSRHSARPCGSTGAFRCDNADPSLALHSSRPVQYGWRWMFTAVALAVSRISFWPRSSGT